MFRWYLPWLLFKKSNPQTPPALQGGSEALKERPGRTGLAKPERPLLKCLHFAGISSEEWEVLRCLSNSKLRMTVARALASQQRCHVSSVNHEVVTILCNCVIKSFG